MNPPGGLYPVAALPDELDPMDLPGGPTRWALPGGLYPVGSTRWAPPDELYPMSSTRLTHPLDPPGEAYPAELHPMSSTR